MRRPRQEVTLVEELLVKLVTLVTLVEELLLKLPLVTLVEEAGSDTGGGASSQAASSQSAFSSQPQVRAGF